MTEKMKLPGLIPYYDQPQQAEPSGYINPLRVILATPYDPTGSIWTLAYDWADRASMHKPVLVRAEEWRNLFKDV